MIRSSRPSRAYWRWQVNMVGSSYELDTPVVCIVVEKTGAGDHWTWRLEDHGRRILVRAPTLAASLREAQIKALLRLHDAFLRQATRVLLSVADTLRQK